MSGGGGGMKKQVIDTIIHKPVQVYLFGGALLYSLRWYQTKSTFNYWFGKCEFERMKAKNLLWVKNLNNKSESSSGEILEEVYGPI